MRKLRLYTSFSFLVDPMTLAFKLDNPDVHYHFSYFRDHPGRLLPRIENERRNGEVPDVVIAPHWALLEMAEKDMLEPYESPELDHFAPEFYDPNHRWTAMALSPVGFTLNSDLVKNGPDTLGGLLSAERKGRIGLHDPVENLEGRLGLVYLDFVRSLMDASSFESLLDKVALVEPERYQCMPQMALGVGKGDIVGAFPTNLSCISYYVEVQERPLNFRMPEDLPRLVTFSPSIGILKEGESKEIAEKFVDFALSETWQQRIETHGGKSSPRPDVGEPNEEAVYFPQDYDSDGLEALESELKGRLKPLRQTA